MSLNGPASVGRESAQTFPFGRPVESCAQTISATRPWFVLGAYPSALHVRWTPPPGAPVACQAIAAMAVDNEPEPFWDGHDEIERIEQWKKDVAFTEAWGQVDPVSRFNGSSGQWVSEFVCAKLGFTRDDAWITDCLDRYHASVDGLAAINARFAPFAEVSGVQRGALLAHPSETEIVHRSIAEHRDRLRGAVIAAQPQFIVTLGNAALRVLREIADAVPTDAPKQLEAAFGRYGRTIPIVIENCAATWYPLAHPAAPKAFKDQHNLWHPKAR